MTASLPKADVIYFFAMPVGDEALALGFWGRDVEEAIATSSPAAHFPKQQMRGLVGRFVRECGYVAHWRGMNECLCVRRGFDERIARQIAQKFARQVEELTEEFRKGTRT